MEPRHPQRPSWGLFPAATEGKEGGQAVGLRCLCLPTCPSGRIFPDLSSNDMLLFIVKGINLPTPPGEGTPGRGQGCGDHLSAQS